jgi:hypothetical protein
MGMGLAARHGSVHRQAIRSKVSLTLQTDFPWRHRRQQHHQRHHVLLFSQTAYQDPTLAWAQSNPRLAQECLNPPPTDSIGPSAENKMESLETYLEWRRWTFPNKILCDQSQGRAFEDPSECAKALISHLLSAPLTMASQFNHIIKNCTNDNTEEGSTEFDWCCIGARAEASIPIVYWKEFLMSSRASLFSEEGRLASSSSSDPSNKSLDISLDFIGPDIPPKLSEQSIIIPTRKDENNSTTTSLCLRGYHRGFFHDSPAMKTVNPNSRSWDAYIFFNPGFGHPNLRKSWESTLKLILDRGQASARKTQCTLLLTAHSEQDMARDAAILSNVYGLKDVVYNENPFASRVSYEDPFEKNHFVRPNHYVATVVIWNV